MNREYKREMERQRRREEKRDRRADFASLQTAKRRQRTGPRQFAREVRGELKRVAWPSRREVGSYSLVVLVTVTTMAVLIFLLDQVFGQLVLWMFR